MAKGLWRGPSLMLITGWLLLSAAYRLHIRRRVGWLSWVSFEERVVVEAAIDVAGDFCRLGAESGASALQEDYDDDAPDVSLGVGSEPSVAGSCPGAGSGLAQNFFLVEIHSQAASCAVAHCRGHAVRNFRNERSDVEVALYAWFEVGDFIRSGRMLQVVERATVSDGGNHGAQLERRHGNALSEGAHLAYTAELGRNLLLRIGA